MCEKSKDVYGWVDWYGSWTCDTWAALPADQPGGMKHFAPSNKTYGGVAATCEQYDGGRASCPYTCCKAGYGFDEDARSKDVVPTGKDSQGDAYSSYQSVCWKNFEIIERENEFCHLGGNVKTAVECSTAANSIGKTYGGSRFVEGGWQFCWHSAKDDKVYFHPGLPDADQNVPIGMEGSKSLCLAAGRRPDMRSQIHKDVHCRGPVLTDAGGNKMPATHEMSARGCANRAIKTAGAFGWVWVSASGNCYLKPRCELLLKKEGSSAGYDEAHVGDQNDEQRMELKDDDGMEEEAGMLSTVVSIVQEGGVATLFTSVWDWLKDELDVLWEWLKGLMTKVEGMDTWVPFDVKEALDSEDPAEEAEKQIGADVAALAEGMEAEGERIAKKAIASVKVGRKKLEDIIKSKTYLHDSTSGCVVELVALAAIDLFWGKLEGLLASVIETVIGAWTTIRKQASGALGCLGIDMPDPEPPVVIDNKSLEQERGVVRSTLARIEGEVAAELDAARQSPTQEHRASYTVGATGQFRPTYTVAGQVVMDPPPWVLRPPPPDLERREECSGVGKHVKDMLTDAIAGNSGVQQFQKIVNSLDANVGNAVAKTCGAVVGGITAVAGTVDKLCTTVNCMTSLVSASAGEAGNFLDMLQGPLDGLVGDALEAVAAHVYANALKPLAEKLQTVVKSIVNTGLQSMLGLCGLFPEVGGAICSSLLMPLSWAVDYLAPMLFNWQVDTLHKKLVTKLRSLVVPPITSFLVDNVRPLLESSLDMAEEGLKEVSEKAEDIGDTVTDAVEGGIESAQAQMMAGGDFVTKTFDDIAKNASASLGSEVVMMIHLLKPLGEMLLDALVPSTTKAVTECGDQVKGLKKMVSNLDCKSFDPKSCALPSLVGGLEREHT